MTETKTHYRTCNICEAMCGLQIQYRDAQVLSIKADEEDPFSRGHICPKAVALQDFYTDPDRLKTPIRRTDIGWEDIAQGGVDKHTLQVFPAGMLIEPYVNQLALEVTEAIEQGLTDAVAMPQLITNR